MATAALARQIGETIHRTASKNNWYGAPMATASRAIADRLPLVDFVLEVRDARIPLSSECELLRHYSSRLRRITVLNKMDLANRSQVKEWLRYFQGQNCFCCGVNSHNKDSVKELLNFLQARVRALKKENDSSNTITMMLVGIPNVGKSALANSLHQVGRISAAEKGKLKHALVSSQPCETKDISSLKIGSHPSIYVLDTPGILPPEILDVEVCSKLALTGAFKDSLVGERELAQFFLAIMNSSEEFKKWEKFSAGENYQSSGEHKVECSNGSGIFTRRKGQYPTDHTQDFMVNTVRRTLFEIISSFKGDMKDDNEMKSLVNAQLAALVEALQVRTSSDEDAYNKVSAKLLNLYRIGRLGHYTLDILPCNRM